MISEPEFCDRRQRAAPAVESSDYNEWEALVRDDGSVGIVCPGCISGEEMQSMDKDAMEMASFFAVCSRCQRPAPEDAPEFDTWSLTGDSSEFLCPGCLSLVDRDEIIASDLQVLEKLEQQRRAREERRGDER